MTDIPVGREFWLDVLRQIARKTRSRADAEDLLHAAYLRLERYRSQNEVTNPAAFLVRTASNIGIDNYRRDRLLSSGELPDSLHLEDSAPLQDEVVAARTRLKRVKEGLDRLTPRTREVFLMHRLEEYKYHEIATRLGISQSAVEKHIAKAALFLTGWMEGW
jgi:RNA polymerase sigma factor (sigma-70 family)